jgi:hypothetical protein
MTQDTTAERDPIEEYWSAHRGIPNSFERYGTGLANAYPRQAWLDLRDEFGRTMDQVEFAQTNGWVSGRYAFAALVWGLIFMLVISAGAGA